MAFWNPNYDPNKPYDEVIIWTPEGLDRLISMDETDVRTDQSKRGKSQGTRSVILNEPGSRSGHSKCKCGRKKDKDPRRRTAVARLLPGQLDRDDALATKSSSKISFAGGTLGNGQSLSPHVMANHPLSAEEIDSAPVGTARDASGQPIAATFNVNTSGGMLEDDMLKWAEGIAAPSGRATKGKRGIWCLDGLGQHHSYKVVKKADELHYDIGSRF
eukprot:4036573-Prymnesium_polylepis.1